MSGPAAQGFGVAPLSAALLADPVTFLSAEHLRQRALLAHLERLARAPDMRGGRKMAALLLRWLTRELPVHIADEEGSLFPRLLPHDSGGVLARLSADHARDDRLVRDVAEGLRRVIVGEHGGGAIQAAAAFVRRHREHIELEEAAVAPLARRVLAPDAVASLADEMVARRAPGDGTCPTER